jgi:hypothetical protein
MVTERRIRPINNTEGKTLINILLINFLLSWTEQSCIFQYIGNMTFDAQPTTLEIFSATNEFDFIFLHYCYIFGILFGSLFFTFCFGYLISNLNEFLISISPFSYFKWTKYLNYSLIALIAAFSISSIPYYGMDYLLTNPLGFTSRDKLLEKTAFSPIHTGEDPGRVLGSSSGFKTTDVDEVPFNRRRYLIPPINQTFEDLNFEGEYAWTSRVDRRSIYTSTRSKGLLLKLYNKVTGALSGLYTDIVGKGKTLEAPKKDAQITKNDLNDQNEFAKEFNVIQDITSKFFILQERFHINYVMDDPRTSETFVIMLDDTFNRTFAHQGPMRSLEKRIKNKFYSNNVFKAFLNIDVDFFMNRQPKAYKLNGEQEKELFKKRIILANYYDSLRAYSQMSFYKDFQHLFFGSKSYADRVFNQQFKGTLKVVRRLFSVTLDPKKKNINPDLTPKQKIILKFDQPLYKKTKENFLLHEELQPKNNEISPFIELTNPVPFYVGWDEQLRKLVITNRLLPQYSAGFEMKLPNKVENKEYWYLNDLLNSSKKIEFTAWPIPKQILETPKSKSPIPYVTLYESVTDPGNKAIEGYFNLDKNIVWVFPQLPSNVKKINNTGDVFPPTRGGHLWPGQPKLKFSVLRLLEDVTDNLTK